MFADSLLESHFTGRAQRGWTTLTSFGLQTLALAGVLMLPLLYTEGLPKLHLLSVSAPIGRPSAPAVTAHRTNTNSAQSNFFHGILVVPRSIPIGVSHEVDPHLLRIPHPVRFACQAPSQLRRAPIR